MKGKIKCPNCGISVPDVPEDATEDEKLCNYCYEHFEKLENASKMHFERLDDNHNETGGCDDLS